MPVNVNPGLVQLFKDKAKPASIEVVELKDLTEAIYYVIDLTVKVELAMLMPTALGQKPSSDPTRKKTLTAPGISLADFDRLFKLGEEKNVEVIRSGLRQRLAGVDVAFSLADLAIAETATCVMENNDEDLRLSTMICENQVVVLPKSKIVKTSYEAEYFLNEAFKKNNYLSFISGPSRTADIERVLTLGVHGPLTLCVLLLEE
ncbi:MAG: lactate utilization protein [Deltaproteobacteria bacterium]|jgi:L-lactate dehydrogenase complex protein LldG|nr:lactate utilization protein [Deltaproteobacteria bacterium]